MPNVFRVESAWTYSGQTGLSVMNFLELTSPAQYQAAVDATRAFFAAIGSHLLLGWTIQVRNAIKMFDVNTGQYQGDVTAATTPTLVSGSAAATTPWAGGVGYSIRWNTGVVVDGRRLTGKTYIVPAAGVFDSADGTLTSAVVTQATNAATNLCNNATVENGVWHRVYETGADGKPHQVSGTILPAASAQVNDRSTVLRKRRLA